MGAKPKQVALTDEERATLTFWAGSGPNYAVSRKAIRARVILAAAEGLTLKEIAARVDLSRNNCLKWRQRFIAQRMDGLQDKPGRGRAPILTAEDYRQVLELSRSPPPDGVRWSLRRLAQATGHSISAVFRILHQQTS